MTTWQIVLFSLIGGLIPCPAAVTVLLLCLQLKEFTLSVVLVLCFSVGFALTLVTVGAAAGRTCRLGAKVTRGRRYAYLPFLYDDAAAKLRAQNSQYLGDGVFNYKDA